MVIGAEILSLQGGHSKTRVATVLDRNGKAVTKICAFG
jgi:hypothetical protein